MFESGKPKLQTHFGLVMSIAMVVILVLYASMKAIVMVQFLDNKISEPKKTGYFAPDYEYDSRDGWRIAFGLTAYDDEYDPASFDESYGTLNIY